MKIANRIEECDDGKQRALNLEARRLLVIHRCGLGEDAEDIAASFLDVEETGGQMPYTFVVRRDGTVEQPLALGGGLTVMASYKSFDAVLLSLSLATFCVMHGGYIAKACRPIRLLD